MKDPRPLTEISEITWPAITSAAAASMLSALWQLAEAEWWPHDAIVEHQFRQLRSLVSHAVAHVPYYRNTLRDTGLNSPAALNVESFNRWPILRKSDLRSNEALLTAASLPPTHQPISHTYTTGSTGEPVRVAHTAVTRFLSEALGIRDHLLHERDLSAKYGAIGYSRHETSQPGWGVINAIFSTGPAVSQSSSMDIDMQLDWLVRERPAYLQSYSSNLLALLKRSRSSGKVPRGIRQLIGYGDMPPEEMRFIAREVWDADFVATYSCMELGPMATQCPGHLHYLVHSPSVYLEVLREDGSSCQAGETGRVVATSLHNFAMPLIRYDLGDYAEVGKPCPTGRGLPTLQRIVGRYRNMLRDPHGKVSWPTFLGRFWLEIAPVQKVRLVQRSISHIDAQYVMERELSSAERVRLRSELVECLRYPFEFSFTRMDNIDRVPGEKWEDFVSMLPEE